jgi:hypothetical protein
VAATQNTLLRFRHDSGYANALYVRTMPISDLRGTRDVPFIEPRKRWANGCSVSVTLIAVGLFNGSVSTALPIPTYNVIKRNDCKR